MSCSGQLLSEKLEQPEQKHSFTADTQGCMEFVDAEELEQPERKHSFTADTHGCMEHEDSDSA